MVKINELLKRSDIEIREAILILCKLLNVDKSYIFTYGERKVSDSIGKEFLHLTSKRKAGYPIQYILGEKEFMGIGFFVEDGVLIPREDTETLVNYVIKYVEDKYQKKRVEILDLGFGSGAISISLAYYLKNAQLYGVDISSDAYRIANINKERLALENVSFLKGDLFKGLDENEIPQVFDIIVSNPPYIESDIIDTLDREVRDFEPRLALDGGHDGLLFYREITSMSKNYLKKDGLLICEIGYNQGSVVKNMFESRGYRDINVLKDLSGNDRVVFGFK